MRLFADSAETKRDDRQIFPDRRDSITIPEYTMTVINLAAVAGKFLGLRMRCGIVGGTLLNAIIVALIIYSTYLYISVVARYRMVLLENLADRAFNRTVKFLVCAVSILVLIFQTANTFGSAASRLALLIKGYSPGVPDWALDQHFLVVVIIAVYVAPICVQNSLKGYVYISWFGGIATVYTFCHTVFWCIKQNTEHGFDPDNRMVYFKLDNTFLYSLRASLTDYQVVPIAWPGPQHIRTSTPNRVLRSYIWPLILLFVYSALREVISYLTLFGENVTSWWRANHSTLWYVQVNEICELIFGLTLGCGTINTARYILLSLISEQATFPTVPWFSTGMVVALLSLAFTGVNSTITLVTEVIHATGVCILTFVVPGILFVKVFGKERKRHTVLACIVVVIGFGFSFFSAFQGIADAQL
jgi:hypothetical protein